jgi:hypothetical protein
MMRKATTGQDIKFVWHPRTPYSGNPTLTVGFSTPFSSVLSQLRSDVSVSSVATDRRTLTLSAPVVTQLERDEVKAFLLTTRDTWFSVKVTRLGGSTAVLAEPLPRELDLSTVATLNFSASSVTIGSAYATTGLYPYTISYTSEAGVIDAESGVLKVTPRPFDTGLDHEQLTDRFPQLADMVPRRQSDLLPQIDAALHEIILAIRDHVIADSCTEDEVFNQGSFLSAHAYCSAALVYESVLQLDVASAMRARCEELLKSALRSLVLDLDGDGVIDEGEVDLRRSGGSATDFRASWRSFNKSAYDARFTPKRGMRH